MAEDTIVVERLITVNHDIDMHDWFWKFALDQRAFGPRRVMVALTDERGRLLEVAHTDRTDPPEIAFGLCLEESTPGAAAAVAYCDEPVDTTSPPAHLAEVARRWDIARYVAREFGVHLVDWIGCDDQAFRSFRLACEPESDGWALR